MPSTRITQLEEPYEHCEQKEEIRSKSEGYVGLVRLRIGYKASCASCAWVPDGAFLSLLQGAANMSDKDARLTRVIAVISSAVGYENSA